MVRKKIDNRIRVLIENGVKLGHRTLLVIVGDKGRDQVRLSTFTFTCVILILCESTFLIHFHIRLLYYTIC